MQAKMTAEDLEKAFTDAVADNRFCALGKLIESHEFGKQIDAKVKDSVTYSNAVVARVLKKLGIVVSADLIAKHRSCDCRCAK